VLLTQLLRAGLACGEYALKTTLHVVSAALSSPRTDGHDGPGAEPTTTNTASRDEVRIRPPDPTERSETVRFALDGQAYEIDLGPEDADRLRAAFRRYIAAGRPVKRNTSRADDGRSTRKPASNGRPQDTAAIREWARAHGHPVSDRGRIPANVLQAYQSAR